MRSVPSLTAALFALAMTACSTIPEPQREPATWDDVVALPAASVGQRIAYGPAAKQFGDLRLPSGPGPHPVAILLHGGCWQAEYDLGYFAHLGDELARAGIATWSLEYRGIGDDGGGWPGTFDDVATGAAHLRKLAQAHPLDLDRVVLVGHSAGGQLALHLAASRPVSPGPTPGTHAPLALRGVVALAGIVDLRDYAAGTGSCNQSVVPLLGGSPNEVPARYAATSPSELLPLGVPLRLLIGARDAIVAPASNERFATQARAQGDDVDLEVIAGAGHFDVVMPSGPAAERVQRAIRSLLRSGRTD
jgi:acetyl esterase/lipase